MRDRRVVRSGVTASTANSSAPNAMIAAASRADLRLRCAERRRLIDGLVSQIETSGAIRTPNALLVVVREVRP